MSEFRKVEFSEAELDRTTHRTALKRLTNALSQSNLNKSSLDIHEYIRFKRAVELYIKALNLVVVVPTTNATPTKTDLAEYCSVKSKR